MMALLGFLLLGGIPDLSPTDVVVVAVALLSWERGPISVRAFHSHPRAWLEPKSVSAP